MAVRDQKARLSARVSFAPPEPTQEEEILWFECDSEHADKFAVDTCDGFFLVALLRAMQKTDMTLRVEGPLSSKLYYNVTRSFMEVLRTLIPTLHPVRIEAPHLTRRNWGGTGVFTGFSAGVDSFATIADHLSADVPPEYKVTHLLFNNVGSHGQTEHDFRIFRERFDRLSPHAQALGLPFIAVNTNIDSFIRLGFQLTHTLRNVAVALVLQKACARYIYSSAVHYRDSYVRPTYDMGYADPVTLPLLSTETTECLPGGSAQTRFGKTETLSSLPLTRTALDVCVFPRHAVETLNCSRCWKCLRTELSLEVMGALPRYSEVFDLKLYHKFRWLYLCFVLKSRLPLLREIREEFVRYRFSAPLSARIAANIIPNKVFGYILNEFEWDPSGTLRLPRALWRAGKRMLLLR